MKIKRFKSRLAAIDWIANYVEDEGEFEVLREQLNFNFIYSGKFYLKLDKERRSVAFLDKFFKNK